jgi:hypothetical protein
MSSSDEGNAANPQMQQFVSNNVSYHCQQTSNIALLLRMNKM